MTTGSFKRDGRVLVGLPSQTSCTSPPVFDGGLVGPYFEKTWSGGDAPKRTGPPSESQGFTYLAPSYKGGKIIGYKEIHRYYSRKRVDARRILGEHAYSATVTQSISDVYTRRFGCEAGTLNYPFRVETYSSDGFIRSAGAQQWTPNHDIALYGQLREAIQGSSFNLGVTLGEGKESLVTIADGATRIYRSILALKKGKAVQAWNHLVAGRPRTSRTSYYSGGRRIKHPVLTLRDTPVREVTRDWIASNWLSFQYGWRPLIQDVHEATKHLAYVLNANRNKTYRVSMRVNGDTTQPYISIYYPTSQTVYTRKSIVARVSTVDEVGLVGLKDPASIAWELMPYSFVADWFIPIGDYLSAKDLSRRIEGTFIVSTKQYSERRGLQNTDQIRGGEGSYSKYVAFQRDVYSSLPSVSLPVVNSYSEQTATWRRAASAISLLIVAGFR